MSRDPQSLKLQELPWFFLGGNQPYQTESDFFFFFFKNKNEKNVNSCLRLGVMEVR